MNNNVKLLSSNLITSSSQLAVSSGSATVSYLIDRDDDTEWSSSGSSEGAAATITWTPADGSATVSRIILKGINWKTFTIQHSGTTDFSPAISSTTNADENLILEVSSVAVTSIVISVTNTIAAVSEKVAADIAFSTEYHEAAYNSNEYAPEITEPTAQTYDMLDGGVKQSHVRDIYDVELEWNFVTSAEQALLLAVYKLKTSMIIVPEPKTSAWNGKCYDVVIVDGWTGEKYSRGYRPDGYDVIFHFRETSR